MNLKEWLIMQKTINKIINNHEKEIKNELENLKHKGFIITPENEIYKFNIFDKTFYKMDPEQFYNLVVSGNINYWNFTPEQNQNIINKSLFDKDNNIFPVITNQEIKEFNLYLEANEFINNDSNIIGKRELNKALKENNNKKTKKDIKLELHNPHGQAQILINNDIFVNENNSLFKYDRTNNNFILLATSGYINQELKDLFINYGNQMIKNNRKSMYGDIENVIKQNLAYYKKQLVYFRCDIFNKQIKQENVLNTYKESYKKVKKIISNFD